MYRTVFEMRGGGGGGGGGGGQVGPPLTAQDRGICGVQGDPGWVPKIHPPISKCLL